MKYTEILSFLLALLLIGGGLGYMIHMGLKKTINTSPDLSTAEETAQKSEQRSRLNDIRQQQKDFRRQYEQQMRDFKSRQ